VFLKVSEENEKHNPLNNIAYEEVEVERHEGIFTHFWALLVKRVR